MKKDFDNWNKIKKSVNIKVAEVYFRERDIWWVSLGTNIGFEQDGKKTYYK